MRFFRFQKGRQARRPERARNRGARKQWARPGVEGLETRALLTCVTISGYVFNDANNNGLFDQGETVFANSAIVLRNASGVTIGTATTDSHGYYQFTTDSSIDQTPTTQTQSGTLNSSSTNWSRSVSVPQFDPEVGTLTSVDITSAATFNSQIQVESKDAAPSTITATVSGVLTLTGPGVASLVTNSTGNSQTFSASAFDGVVDFGGTSGHDFGVQTANGSNTLTLTSASDLAAYIGTGTVSFTDQAQATSSASGAGNLVTNIVSTAGAGVTVVYHYIPSNCIRPGSYTIVQTSEPPGYFDGKDSSNGVVIPGSIGTDTIPVTVTGDGVYPQNDFGELAPSRLSGYVYMDANNNGVKDAGEAPIPGTVITLTGTDTVGPVNLSTTTAADGSYHFTNLRPGVYTVTETQPAGYLDGKDAIGSLGGSLANDQVSAINVPPGANGVHYDFGELLPGSLSGYVYVDANNNGVKDPGEAPIPNTIITLAGTDDLGAAVQQPATTAADGSYQFTGLRPGTYILTETQPANYLDGKDAVGSLGGTLADDQVSAIALGVGASGVHYDFGELLPASLAGYVYVDMNNNGTKDAGEAGIGGVTVALTGTNDQGTVNLTTTTAADGSYYFTNLRPGVYTVTETQPANYLDGKDAVGSLGGSPANDHCSAINVPPGANGVHYDFGELLPGSLSGYVYADANNNGVKDAGEAPIPGTLITLTGTDDLGAAVHQTATTLGDGSYQFTGLRPGTYTLTETQPANYLDGKDAVGSLGGTLANDQVSAVALGVGASGVHYDFGELLPASLAGYVYVDMNNNGTKDAGEAGIGGVTVTLTGTNDQGAVNLTTTTAADGSYHFTNLRPGLYTVTETQPANYLDGKDAVGSLGGTLVNDQVSAINVPPGASGVHYDFGELLPGSLSGYVYVDANNNGVKDAGEAPIPNTLVTLTGTDDLGATVQQTATTAADGSYQFTGLRPGTYTLTETQPAGYLDGKDAVGSLGGTLANDQVSAIALGVGASGVHYDFGELLPASLAGYVYVDTKNNGTKDGGEAGIGGVTVTLTGTNDQSTVNLTTTTAADGSYQFTNLRPGVYTVTETQPANYLDGKDAVGSLGGTLANDQVSAIALGVGASGVHYDFGELLPASLAGFVYVDMNNNGVMDAGEAPIPNSSVALSGTDDLGTAVHRNATTAADGSYQFTDLRPGSYTVVETQPASYLDGKDAVGSLGGTLANDQVSAIPVNAGAHGQHYDFGELLPGSLAGYVYLDANDNGVKEAGETGIGNVTVTLTGTSDRGAVSLTATTAADGSYQFTGLRPGTYTLTETQPANCLDGKDAVGSLGGTLANDQVSAIALGVGASGVHYDFGELLPASLAGFVYLDRNNDGVFQYNESGIAGATVTLNGTNDLGVAVGLVQTTGSDGSYHFAGLRPGLYTILETQPAAYMDGKDTLGSIGGVVGNDQFSQISLPMAVAGINYNFGEQLPSSPTGQLYAASFGTVDSTFAQPPDLTILSKINFLSSSGALLPLVKAEAFFVDGVYRNLLSRGVDSPSLLAWVTGLNSGITRLQFVQAVWDSAEHRGLEVDRLYATFLHRPADPAGRAACVNALLAGMSEADIARLMLDSAEYQSAHADNTSFIAGLANDVLGRVATATELSAWSAALAGGLTRDAVANIFLGSPETDLSILSSYYTTFLRRPIDAVAQQAFVPLMVSGQVSAELMGEYLIASDEYFALAWQASQGT
jgi:protocatechuate 3,4-dioxygenase beta subunit